jgi:hypothetical protein
MLSVLKVELFATIACDPASNRVVNSDHLRQLNQREMTSIQPLICFFQLILPPVSHSGGVGSVTAYPCRCDQNHNCGVPSTRVRMTGHAGHPPTPAFDIHARPYILAGEFRRI